FHFFFFQAEDGIRDKLVTGVQTCALPIYRPALLLRRLSCCLVRPLAGDHLGARLQSPQASVIELTEIHKSFGALEVLRGVSLHVAAGEVICIIGPSGSGKSTLLRCIYYLEVPQRGSIRIAGQPAYYDLVDGVQRPHPRRRTAEVRAKLG